MPFYKNQKPSSLGLNYKGDQELRLVAPEEVFEAKADEIPKHYFDLNWIVEVPKPEGGVGPKLPAEPASLAQPVPDQRVEPPQSSLPERADKPAMRPPAPAPESDDHESRRKR